MTKTFCEVAFGTSGEAPRSTIGFDFGACFCKNRDNVKYKGVRVNGAKNGGDSFF